MKASVFSTLLGSFLLILLSFTIHAEAQTRVMSAQEITSEINTMKDEVTRLQAEINTLEADNKLLSSQLDNTLKATVSAEESSGGSTLAFINFLLLIGLGGGVFFIYKKQSEQSDIEPQQIGVENSGLTKTDFDVISRKIRSLEEKLVKSPSSQTNETALPEDLKRNIDKISAEITTLKTIQKELENRISENEKKVEEEPSDSTTEKKKKSKKSKPKKKKEEDVPNLFDLLEEEVEASFNDSDDDIENTESDIDTVRDEDEKKSEVVDASQDKSTESKSDSVENTEVETESDETETEETESIASDEKSKEESELQSELKEDEITEEEEDDISFDFGLDDEDVEDLEAEKEKKSTSESKEDIVSKDKSISDSDSKVSMTPESEDAKSEESNLLDEIELALSDESTDDIAEPDEPKSSPKGKTLTDDSSDKDNEFSDDFWEAVEALDSDKPVAKTSESKDDSETEVQKSGFDLTDDKKDTTKPLFGLKQSSKKETPKDELKVEADILDADDDEEELDSAEKSVEEKTESSSSDAETNEKESSPSQPKEEPKTGNSLQDALARMKSLTDKSKAEKKAAEEERESKIERNEFGMPKVDVNAAGKSKLADNYENRLNNLKEPEQYAIAARNYPEEQEIKENWALSLIKRGYDRKIDDDIIDAINIMEVIIKTGGRKEGLAHQIMADGLYHLGLIKGEKNYFNRANTQYKKVTEKSGYDGVSMYTNWGNSHINLYYLTNKDSHLKEALDKYKVVNNIYTHAGNYNIARVFNLMGNQEIAMEWLESAFKRKIRLPKLSEIKAEPALKSIVSNPHFHKLIAKYEIT